MGNAAHALIEDQTLHIAPTAERWRAMSTAERDAFLDEALAALQQQAELMAEGSPHIRSKFGIRELLGDFFARAGRKIYLGSELPVHYPGQRVLPPDLLAVLDVEDPGDDDERMAWVVAEEGRGMDLVENLIFYAQLRIPEYFIYDRLKRRVLGYRLPAAGFGPYEPVVPRGGMLTSRVLGLDLGVLEGGCASSTPAARSPRPPSCWRARTRWSTHWSSGPRPRRSGPTPRRSGPGRRHSGPTPRPRRARTWSGAWPNFWPDPRFMNAQRPQPR